MTHTSDLLTQLSGGFSFRGPLSADGLPHGVGTLTGPFGYVYVGEVQAGLPHGRGKETVPWGHTFEGQFEQGLRKVTGGSRVWLLNKASGIIRLKGDQQEPILQHLAVSGKEPTHGITMTDSSGRQVKNLEKVLYVGGSTYTGQLNSSSNKRHGYGMFTTPEGYKYEGNWENDLEHGDGTATYPDGVTYIGDFSQGFKSGNGFLSAPDGSPLYTGSFLMDSRHGQGTENSADGSQYEGTFQAGFYHGAGNKTYANGDQYTGDFVRNCRHGKGTLVKSGEFTYTGRFEGDEPHGVAEVTRDEQTGPEYWFCGRHVSKEEYTQLTGKKADVTA